MTRLDDLNPQPAVVRFADPNPLANCLKTGTLDDLPRVPEDALTVNQRNRQWLEAHSPQHVLHCWLADQVSVISIRIDHNNRTERRARDRDALKARIFWDDDRKLEAETLGNQLKSDPARIVNQLRRTPQGCDWLIDRWARLARVANLKNPWNDTQIATAFDLLGTRPEDRDGPLGEVIDQNGQIVSTLADQGQIAQREIERLQARKAEVQGLDTLNRSMLENDYVEVPRPELVQIRRHSAELHRLLKWYMNQISAKPTYPRMKPGMYEYFPLNTDLETSTNPEVKPTAETPESGRATLEHDEHGNVWPYLIAERRNEQDMKKLAREEARRAKRKKRLG